MRTVSVVVLAVMAGTASGLAGPLGVPRCPKPDEATSQCPGTNDVVIEGVGCQNTDGDVCRCGTPAPPCWGPGVRTGVVPVSDTKGMSDGDVFANSDPSKMFFLEVGENPWINLPNSQISFVPDYALGLVSTVKLWELSDEQSLAFQCPRIASEEGCYMLIYQFRCVGCDFAAGGLPKKLLVDGGWDGVHCGPRFRLRDNGPEYPMASYVKAVAKGTTLTVDLADRTQFIVQTGFRSRYLCENRHTPAACANTPAHPGYCYWHHAKGECKVNLCWRNYGTGPDRQGCQSCPLDELQP